MSSKNNEKLDDLQSDDYLTNNFNNDQTLRFI